MRSKAARGSTALVLIIGGVHAASRVLVRRRAPHEDRVSVQRTMSSGAARRSHEAPLTPVRASAVNTRLRVRVNPLLDMDRRLPTSVSAAEKAESRQKQGGSASGVRDRGRVDSSRGRSRPRSRPGTSLSEWHRSSLVADLHAPVPGQVVRRRLAALGDRRNGFGVAVAGHRQSKVGARSANRLGDCFRTLLRQH